MRVHAAQLRAPAGDAGGDAQLTRGAEWTHPAGARRCRPLQHNCSRLLQPAALCPQAWLAVWAGLLAPACATDDNAAALLDTLVHATFASAEQTLAASPLLPALQAAQHTRAQVLAFVGAKRHWLALAAAQAFAPRLPGDAPLPGYHPGTELLATSSTQPLTALAAPAMPISSAAPSALLADAGAVAMRVATQARQQLTLTLTPTPTLTLTLP